MLCFFVLLLHNYNLLFNGFPFCTVSYYKYNAIIYYYIVIHRTSSHNSIIATAVHDILQLSPWSAHPFTQLSPGLPVHSLSCPNDCQSIPSVVPMTASPFPQLSQWLPVNSLSCPNDCQSIPSVVPMTASPLPQLSQWLSVHSLLSPIHPFPEWSLQTIKESPEALGHVMRPITWWIHLYMMSQWNKKYMVFKLIIHTSVPWPIL